MNVARDGCEGNDSALPVSRRQVPRAADVLARAFCDDRLYATIFDDRGGRLRILRRLFGAMASYSRRYGLASASPGLQGVACWLVPGQTDVTVWRMARAGLGFQRAFAAIPARMRRTLVGALAAEDRLRREVVPGAHFYLWCLGVAPEAQGRGIGTDLLLPTLRTADIHGADCYLEIHGFRAMRFYERLGFEMRGREALCGEDVEAIAMVRPAQAAAASCGRTPSRVLVAAQQVASDPSLGHLRHQLEP